MVMSELQNRAWFEEPVRGTDIEPILKFRYGLFVTDREGATSVHPLLTTFRQRLIAAYTLDQMLKAEKEEEIRARNEAQNPAPDDSPTVPIEIIARTAPDPAAADTFRPDGQHHDTGDRLTVDKLIARETGGMPQPEAS